MDKCWFVLRQTHYPPPEQEILDTGEVQQRGLICIGHLLRSLKSLDDDDPLNNGDPLPYPLDMRLYPSNPINVAWTYDKDHGYNLSGSVSAPIAAATGLTVGADLNTALKRTVHNHWEIDSLEVTITRPTKDYVDDSTSEVRVPKVWWGQQAYMITGLIIARGKKSMQQSEGNKTEFSGGPKVSMPEIAEASLEAGRNKEERSSLEAEFTHDFVWAVRLAKLAKGWFSEDWSRTTVRKGAAFGQDEVQKAVAEILVEDGISPDQILGGAEAPGSFVIPSAHGEAETPSEP